MSRQELKRLQVVELIEVKHMTVREAAALLALSERQMWRIVGRYRQAGVGGLVHGNRHQPWPRRLSAPVRAEIVALAEGKYRDYNDQHLTEVLQEERGLQVSRASVRRVRRTAGLSSPKQYRRRQKRHQVRWWPSTASNSTVLGRSRCRSSVKRRKGNMPSAW
jgi:transposase